MPIPSQTKSDSDAPFSQEEFAKRFQQCYPRMWVIAAAIVRDRGTADDVVQDAALVALKKLHEFRPGTNFEAWVSTIVRFVAANIRRKHSSRKTHPVADLGSVPTKDSADSRTLDLASHRSGVIETNHSPFDDQVLYALNELEDVPRACLLLRIIHDLSFNEIAELLEIPKGTAMSHVHRSKTRIRKLLASKKL